MGMRYLHDHKVIHRDIALRNILVSASTSDDYKYDVKVADFGMSRLLERGYYKTESKEVPVRWTAPGIQIFTALIAQYNTEAIERHQFTMKSDVWSFGVLLYELFSFGKVPYAQFNNSETVEKVLSGFRLTPPENTPPKIAELMLKCWQSDPNLRPTFGDIFNLLESVWREHNRQPIRVADTFSENGGTEGYYQ
jgi:serine/threonine protein kinase